jgi:PAS domain S-box-containing protein
MLKVPFSSESAPDVTTDRTIDQRIRFGDTASVIGRVAILVLLLWGVWQSRRSMTSIENQHATFRGLVEVQRGLMYAGLLDRTAMLTAAGVRPPEYGLVRAHVDSGLRYLHTLVADDPIQRRNVDTLVARLQRYDAIAAAGDRRDLNRPALAESRAQLAAAFEAGFQYQEAQLLVATQRQHRAALTALLCAVMLVLVIGALTLRTMHLRRHRDAALASDAETFGQLAEANPDGVIVHTAGRVIYANAAAADIFGTSSTWLRTRGIMELVHPDDHATVTARTHHVEQHGRPTEPRPIRYLRQDGTSIELEARGAPIAFGGQPAIQVVLRDLSARREAETRLRRSESRFRAVLDAMEEGVVLQDADLAIQLSNPAAERILGLSADQMAGRTSFDPAWRAVNERGQPLPGDEHVAAIALRTGLPVTGVMGVDGTGRSRVWIHVNAVPLLDPQRGVAEAVVVTFTDITAQRSANDRLRESEARYRILAENSADLVSRRSVDHRFEYASPSHEDVLGYTPEELHGRSALELIHPDDRARVLAVRTAQAQSDEVITLTTRMQHRDGQYIWFEIAAAAIRSPAGVHEGYTVSARDVTARLALEEELRQSQKMEVLGRMASGVAHDFNNLLTIVRSSVELLRLERPGPRGANDSLTDIEMATERATALTSHLLTFSRRLHHVSAPLRPALVVSNVTPILRRLAGDAVDLEVHVATGLDAEWIRADAVRFEQVLSNLVGNAKDALPDGGRISMHCDTITVRELVTHRFGEVIPGRYLRVAVSDSGIGMSDDVLARLFDPFYTTKPQGRGTGLGLSIVHGVVHDALGSIMVSSAPGSGSTFTVYWPLVDAPSPETRVVEPPAPPPRRLTPITLAAVMPLVPTPAVAGDDRLILLVDDDASVRRVVARQLAAAGFSVVEADSGIEALERLRMPSTPVHALVTDVRMPGMSGVELVQQMLQDGIACPALIVSGQMDAPSLPVWPDGARVAFLPKPISGVALRRALEGLMREPAAQIR